MRARRAEATGRRVTSSFNIAASLLASLLAFTAAARADGGSGEPWPCSDDIRASLGVDAAASVEVVADACRAWPFDTSITLAAVVSTASGERKLRMTVAMLDGASHRVLATRVEPIEEDASVEIGEGALRLDTARYDLAPGKRAFGVVVHSSARGASCPEGGANDLLTLYVRDDAELRPVLATYLYRWVGTNGFNCTVEDVVSAEMANLRIGVERTRSNGHADLSLTADVERSESSRSDAVVERTSTRTARRVLRYDGHAYGLDPYNTSSFWLKEPQRSP